VRAGLILMLKGGALPESERWRYATLKPGARPLDALAVELARPHNGDVVALRESLERTDRAFLLNIELLLAGQDGARLILVVDQAEELWTIAPDDQRQQFIQLLLTAVAASQTPAMVIFAMRADFLHRAAEHHDLAGLIKEHLDLVSPMTIDEIR